MGTHDEHAIVLGGSVAGLTAARVLSEHFARVTIIERDILPEGPEVRKGVPQCRQLHALLARGLQELERLYPGLRAALVAGGAIVGDAGRDLRWHHFGGFKREMTTTIQGAFVSRLFLESELRRRTLALPNVTVRQGYVVEGLLADDARERVTGATIRDRAKDKAESLTADLVIDATGRGSHAPRWLSALGYNAPPEAVVKVDIGYTSRLFRRDPVARVGIIAAQEPPAGKRFGLAFPVEGERWLVLLGGMLGDHAPQEERGFLDFARSLPTPDIAEIIDENEPLSDFVFHAFPQSRRRYYERLERLPSGFAAIGDAVCSFNPIYGQGMTVAAVEAAELEAWLHSAQADDPRRFYARIAPIVDVPWMLAVGEDFRYPQVTGPKPRGTDLINAYTARLHRTAIRDTTVHLAFLRVAHLLAPPASIFRPQIVARVLFGRSPRPATSTSVPRVTGVIGH
jgi:2-polyprenyl-6-methoxyphenol hydroxylase-like FAD-dependent oxidoreductase